MSLGRIAAVVRFEIRRASTASRLGWWAVLALFPAVMVLLLVSSGPKLERDVWAGILFSLVPTIVCMLGLLLWATQIVHSEIEGNTWPFLAVRPHAKTSVLFGKYLTAVGWTMLAALTGLTVSVLIAQPARMVQLWSTLALLTVISCFSYGALFTFLGVMFNKRPMVVGVAYALVLEFLAGWIPAVINQITVQFRLRTLLFSWMDWDRPPNSEMVHTLMGTGSPTKHVIALAILTIGLLAAAAWRIRQKLETVIDN